MRDAVVNEIFAKFSALEAEVSDLRQGYLTVHTGYTEALHSLAVLTTNASEAAKRAAKAAGLAKMAAHESAFAAKEAACKSRWAFGGGGG